MNKWFRLAAVLAAMAALLCAAGTVWAGEVVARVVAVVGDDVITSQDLDKMVDLMKAQLGRNGAAAQSSQDIAGLRRLALDRLIGEKIVATEVKRLGILVREQELDAFIKRIRESNGLSEEAFVARLNQRGITMAQYRDQLRRDILRRRLISQSVQDRIAVSDAQVEEYYHSHMSAISSTGGVRFQALFIMAPADTPPDGKAALRQKAEGLRKQVAEGADFAKLAAEHSQGPGKERGGELGPLNADDLLPAMRQALAEMKAGQLSEVVEIPGGFVFMKLMDRSGKSSLPTEEVRAQIRQKLEKEAFEKQYAKWLPSSLSPSSRAGDRPTGGADIPGCGPSASGPLQRTRSRRPSWPWPAGRSWRRRANAAPISFRCIR
jgi:peptidyl-prolyl cis-trans isomerase SurA